MIKKGVLNMSNFENRVREVFGDDLIDIVNDWPQLTKKDIEELYSLGITKVYAVYDNWEDVARMRLTQMEDKEYVAQHIVPYMDMVAFSNHIKEIEKRDWLELESGKLLRTD